MFLCEACVLYDMCRLSHLLSSLACRLAPQASGAFLSGAFAFENVPEEMLRDSQKPFFLGYIRLYLTVLTTMTG